MSQTVEDQPTEVGLYPKYHVARMDGRDKEGGDRQDAPNGYFVLDPVYDPRARQALALYAMLAEADGRLALAEDIRANLRTISTFVVEQGLTDEETKIRAVATWTYPQVPNHAYREVVGYDAANALTVAEKAGLDAQGAAQNELGLADFDGWADRESVVVHFSPDA